ncbi:flagellar basal body-associated FliL family protein [Ruegeria sp. EL01]|uniref:flagellar basal body-associated FliL family protein n=1 Tax=Ruegeria sp. EL01 TaxID=2107578 RepID=UPI000EA80908|nr:flagellar basal body-associated FliL family protein [Ruegeria sp. EL01]
MIKLLIPIVFLSVGLGVGIGAGIVLAPAEAPGGTSGSKEVHKETKGSEETKSKPKKSPKKDGEGGFEYLKMTKQFVVPVVEDDKIAAMVTLTLSLEADPAITEAFYSIEPKLRDAFLQVIFDHANTGGFNGTFTESVNLSVLRKALLEVARKDLGRNVSQVLIMSINRQDT